MILVPLIAKQNQRLSIRLGGQDCTITVAQKGDFVYLSLTVASQPVVTNVMVSNRVRLIRHSYLGFVGDLVMVDTQGFRDPSWDEFGMNARFQLVYLEQEDLS